MHLTAAQVARRGEEFRADGQKYFTVFIETCLPAARLASQRQKALHVFSVREKKKKGVGAEEDEVETTAANKTQAQCSVCIAIQ